MLNILSNIYGFFIDKRNRNFDNKRNSIIEISKPVISVGNISVGGTGKTPFVQMLAAGLQSRGNKPAIIGGGYKRKTKGKLIISDGGFIFSNANECGDEMYLLAKNLNVPVIVHDKKYLAALVADEKFDIDVVIVDDGFQHRKLKRNIDIVIIDNKTIENSKLIPAGVLREPLNNISRANIIALNEDVDNKILMPYLTSNHVVIKVKSVPGKIYDLNSGNEISIEEFENIKKGSLAFSGIANPVRFIDSLTQLDIKIIKHIKYADHHKYSNNDIRKIINQCVNLSINKIITTEKDAVKLDFAKGIFIKNNISCYVLPVRTEIIEGEDSFWNYVMDVLDKSK
ncbi:MAG: tetraacyldisaccharide 4'-kinase [FCB group bacterium]|jgi:tetraacyldisaccharide 4'-kinase